MMIKHEPLFESDKIVKHYEEKDGVPVKYVCTSAVGGQDFAVDIFYRSTPHPDYGSHYFGVYRNEYANNAQVMVAHADGIEKREFGMIQDKDGVYHYSAHRHDFKVIDDYTIDGGRAYIKSSGPVTVFKIKDGEFINAD